MLLDDERGDDNRKPAQSCSNKFEHTGHADISDSQLCRQIVPNVIQLETSVSGSPSLKVHVCVLCWKKINFELDVTIRVSWCIHDVSLQHLTCCGSHSTTGQPSTVAPLQGCHFCHHILNAFMSSTNKGFQCQSRNLAGRACSTPNNPRSYKSLVRCSDTGYSAVQVARLPQLFPDLHTAIMELPCHHSKRQTVAAPSSPDQRLLHPGHCGHPTSAARKSVRRHSSSEIYRRDAPSTCDITTTSKNLSTSSMSFVSNDKDMNISGPSRWPYYNSDNSQYNTIFYDSELHLPRRTCQYTISCTNCNGHRYSTVYSSSEDRCNNFLISNCLSHSRGTDSIIYQSQCSLITTDTGERVYDLLSRSMRVAVNCSIIERSTPLSISSSAEDTSKCSGLTDVESSTSQSNIISSRLSCSPLSNNEKRLSSYNKSSTSVVLRKTQLRSQSSIKYGKNSTRNATHLENRVPLSRHSISDVKPSNAKISPSRSSRTVSAVTPSSSSRSIAKSVSSLVKDLPRHVGRWVSSSGALTCLLSVFLLLSALPNAVEGCSSRSTPRPRPSSPTLRPNITFQTYACPPAYAAWYCLNGATCFTVKIGESILYNCECADGYMGQRCEFKDLDGSYLPTREKVLLETASIAGSATVVIVLVFFVIFSVFLFKNKDKYNRDLEGSPINININGGEATLWPEDPDTSFSQRTQHTIVTTTKPRHSSGGKRRVLSTTTINIPPAVAQRFADCPVHSPALLPVTRDQLGGVYGSHGTSALPCCPPHGGAPPARVVRTVTTITDMASIYNYPRQEIHQVEVLQQVNVIKLQSDKDTGVFTPAKFTPSFFKSREIPVLHESVSKDKTESSTPVAATESYASFWQMVKGKFSSNKYNIFENDDESSHNSKSSSLDVATTVPPSSECSSNTLRQLHVNATIPPSAAMGLSRHVNSDDDTLLDVTSDESFVSSSSCTSLDIEHPDEH